MAVTTYKKVLERFEAFHDDHDDHDVVETHDKLKLMIYYQLAMIACNPMEDYKNALEMCEKYMELTNKYSKAFW